MSTIKMKTHHRERRHPGYRMAKASEDADNSPFNPEAIGDPYQASRALSRASGPAEHEEVIARIVDAVANYGVQGC